MAEKKKGFVLADALAGVPNLGTDTQGREQIEYIDIDHIHPDERNFYTLDGIEELAANIEFTGLQQPLRVRPDPDHEGEYIISSGHRRHAALRQLVDSGNEKFRSVPSIVERDAGADGEAAPLLQELRLIYANSDTRKMSSADVSKQAERVEMLLYQLKEAGMDFTGRMRDEVAEACHVCRSRIGRLKLIRENLDGEMLEQWKDGKISETIAHNLAQLPPEHRALVWAHKGAHLWNHGGTAVETYGKRLKAIDASPVPKDCPAGGVCENRAGRREKSFSDSIYCISRCEECCHGCPYIVTCKHACHLLADEIADAKAKIAANKEAQKAQEEKRNAERQAQREESFRFAAKGWRRLGAALEKSGKSALWLAEVMNWCQAEEDMAEWTPLLEGKKPTSDDSCWAEEHPLQEMDFRDMVQLADDLGVSLDYLLCRTDDPNPVPTPGTAPTWQTGTPPEAGTYVCKVISNGWVGSFDIVKWDDQRGKWRLDLAGYDEGDGARVDHWFPLPPTDEDVTTEEGPNGAET